MSTKGKYVYYTVIYTLKFVVQYCINKYNFVIKDETV